MAQINGEKKIGIVFYSIMCIVSFLFAILALIYVENMFFFYFFIISSIFSSFMLLFWGSSKKSIVIKKQHGNFLKFTYWLGFFLIIVYFILFFTSDYSRINFPSFSSAYTDYPLQYNIKTIILLFGLSLMFLSLLSANLLYKKAMLNLIKRKKGKWKDSSIWNMNWKNQKNGKQFPEKKTKALLNIQG